MEKTQKRIKVGFIHNSSNIFLKGNHFDNNYYHFFMKAIRRHNEIEVIDVESDKILNVKKLKENFDVFYFGKTVNTACQKTSLVLKT